jgi:hypothetical protein
MCHVCVINNVKSSMLSRRDFFRKSAAAGLAATAAGAVSARPALAQATGKVVDLTHTLDGDFPTFDGKPGISTPRTSISMLPATRSGNSRSMNIPAPTSMRRCIFPRTAHRWPNSTRKT